MTVCYWCGAKDTLADIGKELDDGKYKMVQCQKCKNAYYLVNKEKMNKPKPITNEEYLHSLNTEQLADLMSRILGCSNCPIPKDGRSCMGTYSGCWHEIIKWLKQPRKE